MTRDDALAAIRGNLSPALDAVLEVEVPPDLIDRVVSLVVGGLCTPAQAAEALTLSSDLGEAALRGELDARHGVELMERLGYRHIGVRKAD